MANPPLKWSARRILLREFLRAAYRKTERKKENQGSRAFAWSHYERASVALYISTKFSITVTQPAKQAREYKSLRQKVRYIRERNSVDIARANLVRDLGKLMASDVPSKIIFGRPISNIARRNIRVRRGHLRSADCLRKRQAFLQDFSRAYLELTTSLNNNKNII